VVLLEHKAASLQKLRLPGHEEALQTFVVEELSDHKSMLDIVKSSVQQ